MASLTSFRPLLSALAEVPIRKNPPANDPSFCAKQKPVNKNMDIVTVILLFILQQLILSIPLFHHTQAL